MTSKEQFYYDKWIEKVAENKQLKLEIERLNKIKDYNSNFKEQLKFLERENKRYARALYNLKRRLWKADKILTSYKERLKNKNLQA